MACATDIPCQVQAELVDGVCVCKAGTAEVGGTCVPSGVPASDGDASSATRDADAGTVSGDDSGDDGGRPSEPALDASQLPTSAPATQPPAMGSPEPPAAGLTPAERCRMTCASGNGCDSAGNCVPVPATCRNGRVEPPEQCDDGNDDPYDGCASCQRARCGDGFIQRNAPNEEDCESNPIDPSTTSGFGRYSEWTLENCDFDTCKRRVYRTCRDHPDCSSTETCMFGVCTTLACFEGAAECPYAPCATLPGYATTTVLTFCALRCRAQEPVCPRGLRCNREFGTTPFCTND